MTNKITRTISLSREISDALDRYCDNHDACMSHLVEKLIRDYLSDELGKIIDNGTKTFIEHEMRERGI